VPDKINLADKLAQFSDHWNPRIIAAYNGNEVRIVKAKGKFTWHHHDDTDECFIVIKGKLCMHLRDGDKEICPGEMIVIPRGVEHYTSAEEECQVMVIVGQGTTNTGNVNGELTRSTLERI
jgi:mannose-6-phosphate isomerase-like protein (cupin superfamily)